MISRTQMATASVNQGTSIVGTLSVPATAGNTLILVLEKTMPDIARVPNGGWKRAMYSSAGKDSILDVLWKRADGGEQNVAVTWLTACNASMVLLEYSGLHMMPIGVSARRISTSLVNNLLLNLVVPTKTSNELLLAMIGCRGATGTPTWSNSFSHLAYVLGGSGGTSTRSALMVAERIVGTTGKYQTLASWGSTNNVEGLLLAFSEEAQPAEPPYQEPQTTYLISGHHYDHHVVPNGQVGEISGIATFHNKSLIVEGVLKMRPGSVLEFVDINSSSFVGGDTVNVDTDPGLIVRDDGVLDLQGTPKVPWGQIGDDSSWQASDELRVSPVAAGDYASNGFASFEKGSPVPTGPSGRYAEVINLSRDVIIRGQSHIHIHTHNRPHIIKNVLIENMGISRVVNGSSVGVLGRYPLHFHHCFESTNGTIVENVVIKNGGNHGIVVHSSSGVRVVGAVCYNIEREAFWWDSGDPTDGVVFDRCFAGYVWSHPKHTEPRLSAFLLGNGAPFSMQIRNCVVAGLQGGSESPAFHWPEQGSRAGQWVFVGNVAHNNRHNGITVWQNVHTTHEVEGLFYQNGESGISHGAYTTQGYHYHNITIEDSPVGIVQHAISRGGGFPTRLDGYGLSFQNIALVNCNIGVKIVKHNKPSTDIPVLYRNLQFDGCTTKVLVDESGGAEPGWEDFVDCGLTPSDVNVVYMHPGSRIRIQNTTTAWQKNAVGDWFQIAPFYNYLNEPASVQPNLQPPIDFDVDGLYEDVDGNGVVDVADKQLLLNAIVDPNSYISTHPWWWDFVNDGTLNILDVIAFGNRYGV